jgi:hypothetical protein
MFVTNVYQYEPKKPQMIPNLLSLLLLCWETLATGSSYAHLVERLSILDIPPLSERHFFDTQGRLGFVSRGNLNREETVT